MSQVANEAPKKGRRGERLYPKLYPTSYADSSDVDMAQFQPAS